MTIEIDDKPEGGGWPYPVKQFVCHQCGNCCRGDGYVELTNKDIRNIAELLELTREQFLDTYCVYDRKSMSWNLIDQGDELQSCIFLTEDIRCKIHDAKPEQCVGFPTRWRSPNIAEYCDGWRALEGLPPSEKKTI